MTRALAFQLDGILPSMKTYHKAGGNPMGHYLPYGRKEKRLPKPPVRNRRSILSRLRCIIWVVKTLSPQKVFKGFIYLCSGQVTYIVQWFKKQLADADLERKMEVSLKELLELYSPTTSSIPALNSEIDIIVPVYNAYEHVKRLFDNIFANTKEKYRLIIIDDASSDPRIWPLLQEIAKKHNNTVVLRNDENRGFVYSVNKAIRETKNHFVILNTDVEVPPNWLERLMWPIVSRQDVASTTPFTNSGTICSFPRFLQHNEPFEGLPIAQIDSFFARVRAEKLEILLPSGVGFCMGMNRDVVNQIGAFDEAFGRGYGEENDWCMRARYKGYKNLLIPNLFVYHYNSASFGEEERKKLMERNWPILTRRHPTYAKLVEEFIKEDPARFLRQFLVLVIASYTAPNTTLIIDHDLGGGANRYRASLIRQLTQDGGMALLYTESRNKLSGRLRYFYKEFTGEFKVNVFKDIFELATRIRINRIFYNNAVSYHDPLAVVAALPELKRLTGAALTIALHDYFCICPSYVLLNKDGQFCGIPQDLKQCATCLRDNRFRDGSFTDIALWRDVWTQCLTSADEILCFSNDSKRLLLRAYPNLADKVIHVKPHRVDYLPKCVPRIQRSNEMRIGVVGNINYQKGRTIVEELARLIKNRGIRAKIFVIGSIDSTKLLPKDVVSVLGPYDPADLPRIIERFNINVFLVPSIGPETFCYVAEELMQLQVPLVVFNIGAPAERVRSYPRGRVVDEITAEAALKTLVELYEAIYEATSQ